MLEHKRIVRVDYYKQRSTRVRVQITRVETVRFLVSGAGLAPHRKPSFGSISLHARRQSSQFVTVWERRKHPAPVDDPFQENQTFRLLTILRVLRSREAPVGRHVQQQRSPWRKFLEATRQKHHQLTERRFVEQILVGVISHSSAVAVFHVTCRVAKCVKRVLSLRLTSGVLSSKP